MRFSMPSPAPAGTRWSFSSTPFAVAHLIAHTQTLRRAQSTGSTLELRTNAWQRPLCHLTDTALTIFFPYRETTTSVNDLR